MIADPLDMAEREGAMGAQELDVELIEALDLYNEAVGEERSS